MRVWRPGTRLPERSWRPSDDRFLFRAEHVDDIERALVRWFDVWRSTLPALGLLRESIEADKTYSAPRFLTLYTAAETYWRGMCPGKTWRPRHLALRAGVDSRLTGANKDAVSLLGAARKYHAHMKVDEPFTAEQIVASTMESTRRLYALMQACLLRDIGIDTETIEECLRNHYRGWPLDQKSRRTDRSLAG